MKKMGQRIREKREENQMTMEELGQKLGVQRQAIHKWEKGEVQYIKRSYIAKMAELFNCDPAWLMGFDSPEAEVTLTYQAPGHEPVTAIVDRDPIMGSAELRALLYKAALEVKPENLSIAIELLKSLS